MSGRYVLDTNIIIGIFANDSDIIREIKDAKELLTTSITVGELYYGAFNSKQVKSNIQKIDEFCSNLHNNFIHTHTE